ncbi:MAG: hypothetical protein V4773_13420 [Verrucomicrobiota bacterium]
MPRLPALLLLFLVSAAGLFATAQQSDNLFLDGKEQRIHSNPLGKYFAQHPERLPRSSVTSSALWRGYVATFEIHEGQLRVRDVKILKWDGKQDTELVSVLEQAFPKDTSRELSWFTGFLILPQGELVNYVHMGYASTFERYRLLFIKDGRVTANRVFTHEEYKEYKVRQFEAYTHSERYKKLHESASKTSRGPSVDSFLYIFDTDFPTEMLVDYKDFKPNSAAAPATTKTK